MSRLYKEPDFLSPYLVQRKPAFSKEQWNDMMQKLDVSGTLYVGNLSFYTTEEQIYELFSKCGQLRRIIMGLNKFTKTPCGFCFIEYFRREDAHAAQLYLSGTKLDDRIIRVDLDPGFLPGRQYGRAKSGGQVRDEHRTDFDPYRGDSTSKKRHMDETPRPSKVRRTSESTSSPGVESKEKNPRFREEREDEEEEENE